MGNAPQKGQLTPQSLVTEEHVKNTLLADKGSDAQLKSWKVVDFTQKGDNYACFVTSVLADYEMNNKLQAVSYVIKLNPCRNFEELNTTNNVIFLKEAKFYLELLPELNSVLVGVGMKPLRFPPCFNYTLERGKEQIYFEDLRARGFKMFDKKRGMDADHTLLVLRELARLHAASHILLSKSTKVPLIDKYDFLLKDWFTFSDNTRDAIGPLFENSLKTSKEMLQKIGGYERAISWIKNIEPNIEEYLTCGKHSEKFASINHGDCWNNNILFRYSSDGKPTEVMLLDLQICRKSTLVDDLNYFMYTSLNGSLRIPNITKFLSTYYTWYKEVLKAAGYSMPFTEDELLVEFRKRNILGAIFGMTILPYVLMDSEEVPDLTGNEDLSTIAANIANKGMEMLDTNPMVKPRFLAIFDELMDTGLIP